MEGRTNRNMRQDVAEVGSECRRERFHSVHSLDCNGCHRAKRGHRLAREGLYQ